MRKFVWITFGVLCLIVASAAGTWATEAISTYDISEDQSAAAAKYWTAERMQKAIPHPTPKISATVQQTVTGTIEEPPGLPGYYPGYDPKQKPGPTADILLDAEADALSPLTGGTSNGYAYPPPHSTFYVLASIYGSTSTPYPYKTIGKVFFTDGQGSDFVCSGASIGGRAVLTAGHCVCDGKGTYYTHWIFVPAYRNGLEPFGKWTASSVLTFSGYLNGGNMGRDIAFAVVKNLSRAGEKLSEEVGHLGFAYNQSRVLHWSMFGYPAVSPWDGKFMVDTEASYAALDTTETPNPTGIGTTQLGGCSGGPWIINFAPGRTGNVNMANGVNSYSLSGQDLCIYTSFFDDSVNALYGEAIAK